MTHCSLFTPDGLYSTFVHLPFFMLIAVPKFAITFSQSEAVSNALKSHDIK